MSAEAGPDVEAQQRRARWRRLPRRVLPEGSTQTEPRVPEPEEPNREGLGAGG